MKRLWLSPTRCISRRNDPSVEDLVNAVLFLVSDLSRSITGITLHVDGGTMAAFGFIDWPFGDGFMPAPLGGTVTALFDPEPDAAPTRR